jgi:predicted enzyme related to lactoylglutathione lyase
MTEPLGEGTSGSSLVLAADDPRGLACFYGALVGWPPKQGLGPGHWQLTLPGAGLLELYAPSARRPQRRQLGRLALCLRREGDGATLQRWLAEARRQGASLVDGPRREPFGWEAWLLDPERNRLLLLVQPPAPAEQAP